MTIDLLVQKTVVHNFLRIPQSTFATATVHSSNGIKPFFYSKQWRSISSNIVETILWIPFLESSEMTIDLLVQMTVVHNFLRIP